MNKLLLYLILMTSVYADEVRIALVIGNNDYVNVDILQNTVDDSRLMKQKLIELGFKVFLFRKCNKSTDNDKTNGLF